MSRFTSWFNGDSDQMMDDLHMKKAFEDHVKKEPSATEIKMDRMMTVYNVYNGQTKTNRVFRFVYKLLAVLFCIGLALVLVFTVSNMPGVGDPSTPANSSIVSQRYIENGLQETGATNIVAGMILTYRAFDTFGETNVLFIATICVMILLMVDEETIKAREKTPKTRSLLDDPILKFTAGILCPVIFIFGIYIILNGHLSPGGGFSGGAILGAGMILYANAFGFEKTNRFFSEKTYKVTKITALCAYGFIGSYFYILGANGIENHIPLGTPGALLSGGIILPIDIAVGVEVACTMYAFFALFRRGGL